MRVLPDAYERSSLSALGALVALLLVGLALGLATGAQGWVWPWADELPEMTQRILWEIRLPRSLGAAAAGALLGLAGAIAQGLFRNPLADPYLMGASSGAGLGVALLLAIWSLSPESAAWAQRLGLTGAAFAGACGAVGLTLLLARGLEQSPRLLLAGVIVGVMLAALSSLLALWQPDILRPMQAFMLGTTGFLDWQAVALLLPTLLGCTLAAMGLSRSLDALSLGEDTARSLGLQLGRVRLALVATLALATAAAVAQAGLIGFVGLVAPHLLRSRLKLTHRQLLPLSALAGAVLLLGADVLARSLLAPQELPVGALTAVLGGGYLLVLMHRSHPASAS
jgi:iron complex transport system permease protein